MKKTLLTIVLLFCGASAFAQSTTVTGTIQDLNGTPYAQCNITANYVDPLPSSTVTQSATINGSPLPWRTLTTSCNYNGVFSFVLWDTNTISYGAQTGGGTWQFTVTMTVQSGTVPPWFGQPVTPTFSRTAPVCPVVGCITGTSVDITAVLQPIPFLPCTLIFGCGVNRIQPVYGTPLTAGDFTFSANWGTGATISNIQGSDTAFTFTMTAGVGPLIDPTVTLTFHDGPWTSITMMNPQVIGGTGNAVDITATNNLTSMTLTYLGLPVATKTYVISVIVTGNSNIVLPQRIASINPAILNGINIFTASNTFNGALNATAGGSLAGTFSGNRTDTGNNTLAGTTTATGPLNSNNLAAGNVANKPASADAVRYVSATGNDSNDGLSMGTAKATISGAYSTFPNCTPVPSVGFSVSPTAPCGTIYIQAATLSVSSGITINGLMVRIVGMGKSGTTINCIGSISCITFNNQSPYAYAPSMSTEGGLYNLTMNGDGSANQIGVFCKTCDGGILHHVRFSNFSGTGANAFEFLNDATGGITERNDWYDVAFDNDTNGILMTTTGATNSNSFGHNFFRHIQWSLNNGQTAWTLGGTGTGGGAAFYSSFVDGIINCGAVTCGTSSATAFSISGTAVIRTGPFAISTDVGPLALTLCSGCTNTNFQVWGEQLAVPGWFSAKNSPIILDVTTPLIGSTLQFQLSEVAKMQVSLDGANGVQWLNSSNSPVFGVSQTGLENQTGVQFFNTTTTCTTAPTAGSQCTTAVITLPVAEPDTAYRLTCSGLSPSGIPVISNVTKSSATQFTITITAITAVAASYGSFDCQVGHN